MRTRTARKSKPRIARRDAGRDNPIAQADVPLVLDWAFQQLAEPAAKLVLMAIAVHQTDGRGAAWLSVGYIADMLHQEPAAIEAELRRLEATGLVVAEHARHVRVRRRPGQANVVKLLRGGGP